MWSTGKCARPDLRRAGSAFKPYIQSMYIMRVGLKCEKQNAESSQRIKYGMVLRNEISGMTYKARNAEVSGKYKYYARANFIRPLYLYAVCKHRLYLGVNRIKEEKKRAAM